MLSWISARLGQVQTSPWLKANSTSPSTALSRKASSLSITSAKKMLGDLPPSSSVAGIRLLAAAWAITRPVEVEPVKAIDRKSTRLNSSHLVISYAVFCLKKKKKNSSSDEQCHIHHGYSAPIWPPHVVRWRSATS